ncbi:hypothetical protein GALL_274300 [mine drainage metagenome]|uniref:Uncharacterized protein n=1 Tax=mine drainage metagenome TaxID=410659 RepID=A0A1J5RF13_9ZZZZ
MLRAQILELDGLVGGVIGDVGHRPQQCVALRGVAAPIQGERRRHLAVLGQAQGLGVGGAPLGQGGVDALQLCPVAQESLTDHAQVPVDAGVFLRQPLRHGGRRGGSGVLQAFGHELLRREHRHLDLEDVAADGEWVLEDVDVGVGQLPDAAQRQGPQDQDGQQYQREAQE